MYKVKYKLITRNKKYDYKVFEETRYNDIVGYEYFYYICNYSENDTIASHIINWKDVEKVLNKLKESE